MYSPWGHKESNMTERLSLHLEHGQERSWPELWICNHKTAKRKTRTTNILLILLKGNRMLWPLPLCHPSPHVLCLPFPYGKLQPKTKFNQKSEKYENQKKKKKPNPRRLNNNKVVIRHRQGPSALSQGLQIILWAHPVSRLTDTETPGGGVS